MPRFVGRAFCVPAAFTGNSPRFLRGEPGIPQRRRCVTIVGQAFRPDSQSDEARKGWVSRAQPLPSFRAERPGFFLARVVCAPGRVGRNLSFLHLRTAAPSPRAFCGMNLSPSSAAASSSRHLRIRSNLTKVRRRGLSATPADRAWPTTVAPGFAPVCADSPRFLRGEPGTNPSSGGSPGLSWKLRALALVPNECQQQTNDPPQRGPLSSSSARKVEGASSYSAQVPSMKIS